MGAQLEALFVEFGEAGAVALFHCRAAFAFVERLHPEGFGDVGDAFGQRCRAAGPESNLAERVFHQESSMELMVLGEPLPNFARIFSMAR